MTNNYLKTISAIFLISVAAPLAAQTQCENENEPVGASPPVFDESGDWKMTALGEATCYTCTRTQISNAKRAALIRARDELAKFRSTQQSGAEVLGDQNECQEESGPEGDSAKCKSVQQFASMSTSEWNSMLKGVVALEECIIPAEKVVRVTVGISSRSMDVADDQESRSTSTARPAAANNDNQGAQSTPQYDRPTESKSRSNRRDF